MTDETDELRKAKQDRKTLNADCRQLEAEIADLTK